MSNTNDKTLILRALREFVSQRPGLEYANYGNASAYRSDARRITRALGDFYVLVHYVQATDGITAEDLVAASERAYGGRLTIERVTQSVGTKPVPYYVIHYTTGQYFCTEYRNAVCAMLAAALWDWQREHMPEAFTPPMCTDVAVWSDEVNKHGRKVLVSPGEWLRRKFRQQFGRGIQSRWFN